MATKFVIYYTRRRWRYIPGILVRVSISEIPDWDRAHNLADTISEIGGWNVEIYATGPFPGFSNV